MKSLTVWVGPMGSSKTTGALHAARRFQRLGHNVRLVRPKVSLRSHESSGLLVTKNGESFPAAEVESAFDIPDLCKDFSVVWIDEAFLFNDEQALFRIIQSLRETKEILISALSADSFMRPFKTAMPQLLAVADDINYCKADCDRCKKMGIASRTLRISGVSEAQTLVGGVESYKACCVECFNYLMQFSAEERHKLLNDK